MLNDMLYTTEEIVKMYTQLDSQQSGFNNQWPDFSHSFGGALLEREYHFLDSILLQDSRVPGGYAAGTIFYRNINELNCLEIGVMSKGGNHYRVLHFTMDNPASGQEIEQAAKEVYAAISDKSPLQECENKYPTTVSEGKTAMDFLLRF